MHSIADYFLEVLMGRFLNPDNGAFSEAVNSEIYIDKTRLLEYTNQVINTTSKFICNSRPRRFGKSMTADMLSAYYSRGCDSKELFKNYEISTVSSYEKNLNKYDVLTYLIHLGYLAYDQDSRHVFIPNEEIRHELNHAVKRTRWNEMVTFQKESLALLDATLEKDGMEVAKGIEKIHTGYSSTIMYHDENSLSSVLTIAYLSSMQYYFKPIRELPTGRGFADFVYIPKPEYKADYPALVVELKWNKTADTALQQIKDRKYPQSLEQYTGNILLVGINYDKKTKEHSCVIENDKKQ